MTAWTQYILFVSGSTSRDNNGHTWDYETASWGGYRTHTTLYVDYGCAGLRFYNPPVRCNSTTNHGRHHNQTSTEGTLVVYLTQ